MSTYNDRALRFYHEVLGLERLHYGLWLPEDELSYENLKQAQKRYETYLIRHIPAGVRRILDVGCGTGILAARLMDLDYQVEGLSPDVNQKHNFTRTVNAPFHQIRFEDFSAPDAYDCIIMSESAQYIAPEKIFENAGKALKNNGFLMICDYFVLGNARGALSRSGHVYPAFKRLIPGHGFRIVHEDDITDQVTKTLDMGKAVVEKFLTALGIGLEKIQNRHPRICRLLLRIFRHRFRKQACQIQLLDSRAFREHKTYRFILLQRTGNAQPVKQGLR